MIETPPSPSGRGQGEGLKIRRDLPPSPSASVTASPYWARASRQLPLPVGEAIAAGTISGLLLVLSLPKPDLYPLSWIALIPWLYLIGSGISLRQTLTASYAAGLVFFAGTFYWIAETMVIYGGLLLPLGVVVSVLFVLCN